MCISPGELYDGTQIACRKCWQCLDDKVDDWVGRCLAESKTAKATFSITLTYGRDDGGQEDHVRSAWLTYSDVQKMFKILRIDGYRFRYLVCGEYGSLKGRAHWHALIFFEDAVPPHELSEYGVPKRFHNKYWPHGYQHWEAPSPASIRYVCKYINKDMGKDERQGHMAVSKKPPLGDMYFRMRAKEYVDAGLAPQELTYVFPEVKDKEGRPKKFFMSGTTAKNFIEYYKAAFAASTNKKHHPVSAIIDKHDDKYAKGSSHLLLEPYKRKIELPFNGSRPQTGINPATGYKALYSDDDIGRWWYVKNEEGWAWQREDTMIADMNRGRTALSAGRMTKPLGGKTAGSTETAMDRWIASELRERSR